MDLNNLDFTSAFTISLSEEEYRLFADLIYERSGINLGPHKKELVKGRLMKRLRQYHCKTYREYYEHVIHDETGKEVEAMVNAITTNVTNFFREQQHFDFLQTTAFPQIVERKRKEKSSRIRIWSAACSTGEEVYSILMSLCEYFKDLPEWDIKILGTDISTKALAVAQSGTYAQDKLSDLSPLLLSKYFVKQIENREVSYTVNEHLRSLSVFRVLNLMNEYYPFKGKFDIIFCRNVMIYFDKETQSEVVQKMTRYLQDYGYLFVGHSEASVGMFAQLKKVGSAVYTR